MQRNEGRAREGGEQVLELRRNSVEVSVREPVLLQGRDILSLHYLAASGVIRLKSNLYIDRELVLCNTGVSTQLLYSEQAEMKVPSYLRTLFQVAVCLVLYAGGVLAAWPCAEQPA
jgi:hypothetical protein